MKKLTLLIISSLVSIQLCKGQNNDNKDLHILYIIKYKPEAVKTNHLICSSTDIKYLDIHSKSEKLSKLASMTEEQAVFVSLKKNIKLLSLETLFEKYKINEQYRNLPIRIDGKEINFNPKSVVATNDGVDTIFVNKTGNYLNITSRDLKGKRINQ